MYKPSDKAMRIARVLALLLPVSALAGLSAGDAREPPVKPVQAKPADKPAKDAKSAFRLRCYQYGRLLFEEVIAALPSDGAARYTGRITATDLYGRPLQVTELQSTTCMVQSADSERAQARER